MLKNPTRNRTLAFVGVPLVALCSVYFGFGSFLSNRTPTDTVKAFLTACKRKDYDYARSFITLMTDSTASRSSNDEGARLSTMRTFEDASIPAVEEMLLEIEGTKAIVTVPDRQQKDSSRWDVFYLYQIEGVWRIKGTTSKNLHDLMQRVEADLRNEIAPK